jgi:methylglutaconyl-CoA hydratase
MDLKEAGGASSAEPGGGGPPAGGRIKRSVNEFPAILEQIWTGPKPVVAKLAGPARAGGVGLVAAADIAVASEDASFAFTEVRIGVVPAVISVTVLPRLLPRAAHELFLTGEKFSARRAVEIGLLNAAVPAAELDGEVTRYTGMLALGGPNALAATKRMLRRERPDSLAADLAAMTELSAGFFASAEGQEGILAFAQKRTPNWVPS